MVPERKRAYKNSQLLTADKLSDEIIDKCIELYLTTGNKTSIAKYMGKSRAWAAELMRHPRVTERMRTATVGMSANPNVANIEECMMRLTSIMRGSQLKELAKKVQAVVKTSSDAAEVADAIKGITRFTPQVENNQIKALTMLLTAQGALDPRRAARDDTAEVLDDLVLALVKSRSVDAILSKLNTEDVIDVTDGS